MKIELEGGLSFNINDGALNDWRLIELLADMEEDPLLVVKVARMLLTKDSYKKLLEVNTADSGQIDAEKVANMLTSILLAGNTTKK